MQIRMLVVHRGADAAHRVGKVQHPGIRAEPHDVIADGQNRRDDPEGMKQPTGAAVLAIDLTETILLRDRPVLLPELEPVPDLNRDDDIVRVLERSLTIGCRLDRVGQLVLLDMRQTDLVHPGQGRRIDVVQHHRAALQYLAAKDIGQRAQPKLRAPAPTSTTRAMLHLPRQ